MRPPGEVRQALLRAHGELASTLPADRHGPTLKELANKACVGYSDAMHTLKNLTRAGELEVAGTRRVEYRNRPVAEYARPAWKTGSDGTGFVTLGQMLAAWKR